ncbi:hypothetical protein JFL43_17570 [Viridibacillus sp. YIM B01967]|uniref:ABC transporter permease n=1 Tax=Viridibacillus soli TaxID=2798301 RepID=A0ABS1HB70_9BACL|nr:hypothetical protein [Viridibacillus soli]MBK3496635.1 hypothetical protein [Viridibacillus soli]
MGKWKGLFRREWLLYHSWIWGFILAIVVTIFLVSAGIAKVFGLEENYLDIALILTAIWIFAQCFVVTTQFCMSLNQDAKRTDVWLHTPATTNQLLSAKIMFSSVFTIIVLLVTEIIGIILLVVNNDMELGAILQLGTVIFMLFALNSLFSFVVVLLFWIFYMKIKPFTGNFAGFITVIVGITVTALWSNMMGLTWVKKWTNIMEIPAATVQRILPKIKEVPGTMEIQPVYIGSFLFYAIVTILFYVIALKWFDRGVEQR